MEKKMTFTRISIYLSIVLFKETTWPVFVCMVWMVTSIEILFQMKKENEGEKNKKRKEAKDSPWN